MKRSVFLSNGGWFQNTGSHTRTKITPEPTPAPHSRGFGSKQFAKSISSRGSVHGKRDVVCFDEELTLILHIKGRQILQK